MRQSDNFFSQKFRKTIGIAFVRISHRNGLLLSGGEGKADEFDAVCRFLEDVKAETLNHHSVAFVRYITGCMEYISGERLIGVILGQVNVELFVNA